MDENNGVFYLYQASYPIANNLRVTMMDKVPSMAINVVNVTENESILADELIVQRLGLIPLVSNQVDNYLFSDQCDCSGQCSKCSAVIYLKIKSINLDNLCQLRHITSCDLTPSKDHQIKPVKYQVLGKNQGIPIVPLRNDQALDFECFATKGCGSQHAKWSTVSKVVYWPDEEDTSDNPRFYFSVETTGALTVLELLKSACQILATKSIKISIRG